MSRLLYSEVPLICFPSLSELYSHVRPSNGKPFTQSVFVLATIAFGDISHACLEVGCEITTSYYILSGSM